MPEEPDIVVREVMGEKRIAFRGLESLDISEKDDVNWVEDYEDALIELSDIEDSDLEGVELAWNAGRAVARAGDEAKFAKLVRQSEIDIADPYTLQRYHNFYKMFRQGDYDTDYPLSVYTELAITERVDKGRDAFDRLKEEGEIPRVYEVRAWAKCYQQNDFTTNNIVENILQESKTQTGDLDSEQLIEGVDRVLLMAGIEDRDVDQEGVTLS